MPPSDPHLWQKLALLAVAGAAGTLARFGLWGLVERATGNSFPWGTFAVNGLGCLLFGLVWSLAEERVAIGNTTRLIALAGFMGAFTTFSTFAFETARLMDSSQWFAAAGNVLLQNVAGMALLFAGIALGKIF